MAPVGCYKSQYPKASLLGLSPELTQRILYEASDMTEISDIVKQLGKTGEELAAQTKVIEHKLRHR
jgi:hypothetical protein